MNSDGDQQVRIYRSNTANVIVCRVELELGISELLNTFNLYQGKSVITTTDHVDFQFQCLVLVPLQGR